MTAPTTQPPTECKITLPNGTTFYGTLGDVIRANSMLAPDRVTYARMSGETSQEAQR